MAVQTPLRTWSIGTKPVYIRRTFASRCRTAHRPQAVAPGSTATQVDQPPSLAHLKDPAKIGSTGTSTSPVKDMGGDVSLNTYMTLPVEQYFVLDPSQIRFLGGDRFLLIVPRINIFNVWLEPMVEVTVKQDLGPSPKVLLIAQNCRIKGSDLIQQWRLDERFAIRFVTELTWLSSLNPSSPSTNPSTATALTLTEPADGQITASAELEVWSEVIPPFNLMPREMLLATCNAVMSGLVNSLLPLFSRRLASDYQKWAADPDYRADRARRSSPLS